MAGRGDIKAGGAFVELFLKNNLTKQLTSVLATGATALAGFGAAAVAGAGVALVHFAKFGSELHDMSQRTGVAAGSLAELKFAAEQSGAGLEDVETGLRKMAKGGFDVAKFDEIGASINAIQDPSERAAKAMEVFGKSGTKLLPMLTELKSLRAEAGRLGLAPSQEDIDKADALGDAFDKLKSVFGAAVFNIGAALAPIATSALNGLTELVGMFNRWIKTNETVVGTIRSIGDALMGGQLQLAAQIATAAMTVPFEQLKLVVMRVWEDIKLHILSVLDSIQTSFAPTVAYMTSLWESFTGWAGAVFLVAFGASVTDTWNAFKIGAGIAINSAIEMLKTLLSVFQTIFGVMNAGFNDMMQKISAIARVSLPIISAGGKGGTGFDLAKAMADAGRAAEAAGAAARAGAPQREADRKAAAAGRIAGQEGAVTAAQAKLDALKKQAAELKPGAKPGAGPAIDPMEVKRSVAVGYSAAGLIAQGAGGGASDPVVRELKEGRKRADKQVALLQKIEAKKGLAIV